MDREVDAASRDCRQTSVHLLEARTPIESDPENWASYARPIARAALSWCRQSVTAKPTRFTGMGLPESSRSVSASSECGSAQYDSSAAGRAAPSKWRALRIASQIAHASRTASRVQCPPQCVGDLLLSKLHCLIAQLPRRVRELDAANVPPRSILRQLPVKSAAATTTAPKLVVARRLHSPMVSPLPRCPPPPRCSPSRRRTAAAARHRRIYQ